MNAEKLQILHLEDDRYDAELAQEMLLLGGIECDVTRVDTEVEFVAALKTKAYDMIIADNALPTFDGLSALGLARQITPQVPFIFLSGSLGEEVAIESLKSGATDYVLKQRPARLIPVVQRAFREAAERRQRREAEAARLAEMEAVSKFSAALRVAESRTEMTSIIMREIRAMLQADGVSMVFQDPGSGEGLDEAATEGFGLDGDHPLRPRSEVIHQVLRTGAAHLDNAFGIGPQLPEPGGTGPGQAVACVPLRRGDTVIGALWLGRAVPISRHDLNVLVAISDIAANAIHRTTLHERTLLQVQRLAALRDIDRAITSNFDLSLTIGFLLEKVTTQLKVDAAAVLGLGRESNRLEYLTGRGFRGENITRTQIDLGEGYSGKAAQERRLVMLADLARANPPFLREAMIAEEGFVNFFAVPLIVKTQVRGVLEVFNRTPFRPMPEWLDFLQTLANQAAIAIENAELYEGLQRSNTELRQAYDSTIEGWSRALDLRDRETEGHTQRVAEFTVKLARRQGFSQPEIDHIRRGALLHDIGKLGIPDQILLKPEKLTEEEWVVMRMHPTFAYDLLSPIAYLWPALDIPYCHHEKWDGSGYPRGLRAEEIPLSARLFAVADVWDALRSDRPYRRAWPEDRALAHIRAETGTHFDPEAVALFLEVLVK